MRIFDLYGTKVPSLDAVVDDVGRILKCTFEDRESSYFGLYATAERAAGGTVKIQPNEIPDDDEPLESEATDCRHLIYVDDAPDADEVRSKLSALKEVVFIRRTTR